MAITIDIINALKTDLLKINGLGNYTTKLKKALGTYKQLGDIKPADFDCFYIQSMPSKANYQDSCINWDWGLAVYFYVKAQNDANSNGLLSEKIEILKADIRTLFETALTVEAIPSVVSIQILYEDPYLDLSENEGKGLFLLLLEINYND